MTETDIPITAHKQVTVKTPWGEVTAVDEGLVTLLKALWDKGYFTQYSCQGGLAPGTESEAGGQAQPSQFTIPMFFGGTAHPSDAHIIFTHYENAASFMEESVRRLSKPADEVEFEDDCPEFLMSMQACRPLDGDTGMRGDVWWYHELTPRLIEVWS